MLEALEAAVSRTYPYGDMYRGKIDVAYQAASGNA